MTSPLPKTDRSSQPRGASLAVLAAVVVWLGSACASPDDLPLPGATDLPPKPAALGCSRMGAYATFANNTFLFADLDRGVSCEQYFEQDQCILAVFRDCSFSVENERERHWTGITGVTGDDRFLRLEAGYTGDSRPAKLPVCCEGTLLPNMPELAEWSLLECRSSGCSAEGDVAHAGFYVERLISFDPNTRTTGTAQTLGSDLIASASDATTPSSFWLLLQDSLQKWDSGTGTMISSHPINDSPLSLSAGPRGVFVGGQQRWFFVNPAGVMTDAPTGGRFVEVLDTPAGLLALRDNLGTRELLLLDPNTANTTATASAAAISDLIPWEEPGYLAAGLLQGNQFTLIKNDLSTEPKLGLWTSRPGQRTLLDFTGAQVTPSTPLIAVGPQRAAFSAPCHADADIACWFEFGGSEVPSRVGLGIGGVMSAWVVPGGRQIAFGTGAGQLMVLDRRPHRPRLQEVLQFGGSIRQLAGGLDEGCARAWFSLAGGRELMPAHLEDCSRQ